jgi:hypothetical protein
MTHAVHGERCSHTMCGRHIDLVQSTVFFYDHDPTSVSDAKMSLVTCSDCFVALNKINSLELVNAIKALPNPLIRHATKNVLAVHETVDLTLCGLDVLTLHDEVIQILPKNIGELDPTFITCDRCRQQLGLSTSLGALVAARKKDAW